MTRNYCDLSQELTINLLRTNYNWKDDQQKEINHEGRRDDTIFDNDGFKLQYEIEGHIERG